MWVVAELAEHPGAEDRSQAGLGQDDLSVRVRPKMRLHLPFHHLDLRVEGRDDRGQCPHHRSAGRGDHGGLGQLLLAQRGADRGGLGGDITAPGALERGADLGGGQPRRRCRVRGLGQQLQGVGGVRSAIGLQRGGEEVPQLVPQPLRLPGPFPDQRLVRAGHHLDRLHGRAVRGDRPQLVRIGAHHVSQGVRISGVALGTGDTGVPGSGPPAAG